MADPLLEFEQEARQLLDQALPKPAPAAILLETPPGRIADLAFPTFGLAKVLRKAPDDIARDLAQQVAARLAPGAWTARVQAQGGYVNFSVNRGRLAAAVLERVHLDGANYGSLPPKRLKVMLEHTSANPNGPLHVGRARNPIIGDTLARILRKAGYDLETQYYVDDMGKQVALLAWGRLHLKPTDLPPAERDKIDHQLVRYYQAAHDRAKNEPRAEEQVQELVQRSGEADAKTLQQFEDAYRPVLEGMLESLREIGVTFDSFQKESEFVLNGETARVIERLQKSPLSRQETDGALFLDLSTHGIHGRSQRFVYRRSDGTSLYPTRDVAYHFWKANHADRLINVLGEDHKLQAQQVRICLQLLGCKVLPEVIFYAFVSLPDGKMSTRRGNVVYLDDLLEEAVERAYQEVKKRRGDELSEERMRAIAKAVGVGALRYNIVRVQPEKGIVFKWKEALNFEGSSAPFLQYAHTRCAGILRKAGSLPAYGAAHAEHLTHASEHGLLFQVARLPRVVEEAAARDAPHLVAGYAQELASALSAFYRDCPVLNAEPATLREARLRAVHAAKTTLHNTLDLLGIPALEEM